MHQRFLPRPLLRPLIIWRCNTTSTSTTALFNTTDSVRRALRPVVKLIHPDLFAQEDELIRDVNLSFLQTLNELADIIDDMVVNIYPKKELAMRTALNIKYKFEFYSRTTQPVVALTQHKVEIRVPEEFTTRSHVLPYAKARRGIETLLHNLGEVFVVTGLVNPWHMDKPYTDNNAYGFAMRNEVEMDEKEIQAEIDARLNEKAMQRVSNVASMFNIKMQSGAFRDVQADIDRYITNGNIMMMPNVTVEQEVKALERFRSFILQFNHLISFSFHSWTQYIFFFDAKMAHPRAHQKKHRMYIYIPLRFSFKEMLTFLSELNIALDISNMSSQYQTEEEKT